MAFLWLSHRNIETARAGADDGSYGSVPARGALRLSGLWGLLVLVGVFHLTQLTRIAKAQDREDIVDMVIRAITHNYEQIKTAEATIEVITKSKKSAAAAAPPPPKPEEKITGFFILPSKMTVIEHVIVRGEDLRYEGKRTHIEGDGGRLGKFSETIVRKDGKWWRYTPSMNRMAIRRVTNGYGRPPIDPRQAGAYQMFVGVTDFLRTNQLVDAELVDRRDASRIARLVYKHGPRHQVVYEFDSAVGFLPTRTLGKRADGSIISIHEVSYQDVLDGKAKFVKEVLCRYFERGAAKAGAGEGWRQSVRSTVTELRINEEVPESVFNIDVPIGTIVTDQVAKRRFIQGRESPLREP